MKILPVADVVLHVGSQEKYHDKLGWDLFLEQKNRRAFAFVLNKWDRCQQPGAGVRPDEDWLQDLKKEGFKNPLLFRTIAQHWVDHPEQITTNGEPLPVEGEQFRDLLHWLEAGLTLREIEAIKARGVEKLLIDLQKKARRGVSARSDQAGGADPERLAPPPGRRSQGERRGAAQYA